MDKESKSLRYARINVYLTAALLLVLCVGMLLVLPRALKTLRHAEDTLDRIDSLAVTAEEALTAANTLITDNADAAGSMMEKFNSVDFDTLNKAIQDLADIVEPMAKISSLFSR